MQHRCSASAESVQRLCSWSVSQCGTRAVHVEDGVCSRHAADVLVQQALGLTGCCHGSKFQEAARMTHKGSAWVGGPSSMHMMRRCSSCKASKDGMLESCCPPPSSEAEASADALALYAILGKAEQHGAKSLLVIPAPNLLWPAW